MPLAGMISIGGFDLAFSVGMCGKGILVSSDMDLDAPELRRAIDAGRFLVDYLEFEEYFNFMLEGKLSNTLPSSDHNQYTNFDDYLGEAVYALQMAEHITEEDLADRWWDLIHRIWEYKRQVELGLYPEEEVEPKPKKEKRPGFVYLLKMNGVYKIGLSNNPDRRVEEIYPLLPYELETVWTVETEDCFGLEKELHQKYADKRLNGEWFNLNDDDVEYIMGLG